MKAPKGAGPKGKLRVTAVVAPKLGGLGKKLAAPRTLPAGAGPKLGAGPLGAGAAGPMAPRIVAPRGKRL